MNFLLNVRRAFASSFFNFLAVTNANSGEQLQELNEFKSKIFQALSTLIDFDHLAVNKLQLVVLEHNVFVHNRQLTKDLKH